MESAVVIALIAQWVLLLGLGVVVLALIRQIGVLHQRIGPAGALMISKGVKIGERSQQFKLQTLDGVEVTLGAIDPAGRSTLVMFVAPDCPVCASLLPALKFIGKQEASWLRLVFASDGDPAQQAVFRREKNLEDFPYVLSPQLGMSFQIGKLPYGVLLDANGIMISQGLCNSREHVESLFEAKRLGVASLQDYLQREGRLPLEQKTATRDAPEFNEA